MEPVLQNSTGVWGTCWQPFTGSQESTVQPSPSLQGLGACVQAPVAGTQESTVHWLPSSQSTGVPATQVPATQVSTPLQRLPSLQSWLPVQVLCTMLMHQPPEMRSEERRVGK